MITIIDYGVGNVRSVANMLNKIGEPSLITDNPDDIRAATSLILPGVGAFDTAMNELEKRGLKELLHQKVMIEKTQVLGICLGMQLLTDGSEEGKEKGFGWIPGFAYRFPQSAEWKVPHMRWNSVTATGESPLLSELEDDARFYFVHSYYVKAEERQHAILSTEYGLSFDAALQKDNIMGVQFHPERSHKFGLKLLYNFTKLR